MNWMDTARLIPVMQSSSLTLTKPPRPLETTYLRLNRTTEPVDWMLSISMKRGPVMVPTVGALNPIHSSADADSEDISVMPPARTNAHMLVILDKYHPTARGVRTSADVCLPWAQLLRVGILDWSVDGDALRCEVAVTFSHLTSAGSP
jgi:hypothetical protein